MKVLVLTVTAGQGHNRTANAISDYFKSQGGECVIIDALEYVSPVFRDTFNYAYLLSTKHIPSAYGNMYSLWEKRTPGGEHSMFNQTLRLMRQKLKKFIAEYNPDAIICTHVLAAQMITTLKDRRALAIGVITDFTVHPYWEDTKLDYYVVPSEFLEMQCRKKGIGREKVLPIGIPIVDKFRGSISKEEARKILGIEDRMTILMMSGSMGFGKLSHQVAQADKLDGNFQILCVCGNNEKEKNNIDSMEFTVHKIYTYGFVDNIEVMMDAADVLVTKPGGLTVSEALAKKIPIVMINPIPGQEERNAEFLLNSGAAMLASEHVPLDMCLNQLVTSPERLENMKNMATLLSKPDSTERLFCFIAEKIKENQ